MIDKYFCDSCGDECEIIEETFDYAGTHCTNGRSGTHRTGRYLSKCCLADYTLDEDRLPDNLKTGDSNRNIQMQ